MGMRTDAGQSQSELGRALGVSKQSISNWENGNIMPSVEMLERIADHFRMSTDYVLGREAAPRLDTTGLTDSQVAHIRAIIKDILILNTD